MPRRSRTTGEAWSTLDIRFLPWNNIPYNATRRPHAISPLLCLCLSRNLFNQLYAELFRLIPMYTIPRANEPQFRTAFSPRGFPLGLMSNQRWWGRDATHGGRGAAKNNEDTRPCIM